MQTKYQDNKNSWLKFSMQGLVKRRFIHPFFKKVITSSKKYHAHDEKNEYKIGDIVNIIESKPRSKKKRWEVQVSK